MSRVGNLKGGVFVHVRGVDGVFRVVGEHGDTLAVRRMLPRFRPGVTRSVARSEVVPITWVQANRELGSGRPRGPRGR